MLLVIGLTLLYPARVREHPRILSGSEPLLGHLGSWET